MGFTTHVVLVGAVSLLEGEDGDVGDAAVLPQGEGLRGEGQDGLVAGRQPREPQLGQVVDEEVELGGHAAQTGLDQPAGGARETKRAEWAESSLLSRTVLLQIYFFICLNTVLDRWSLKFFIWKKCLLPFFPNKPGSVAVSREPIKALLDATPPLPTGFCSVGFEGGTKMVRRRACSAPPCTAH